MCGDRSCLKCAERIYLLPARPVGQRRAAWAMGNPPRAMGNPPQRGHRSKTKVVA